MVRRFAWILAVFLVTWSTGSARGQDEEVRTHMKSLQSPSEDVRIHGAMSLSALGGSARAAVLDLVTALFDESEFVRMWAVLALGKMQPEARAAAGELRRLAASDPNRIVRANAKVVLKRFGLETLPPAVPVVPDSPAGSVPDPRVEALVRGLTNPVPEVRQASARKLGALGPAAASARKTLGRVAERDPDPAVRAEAAKAVAAIGGRTPEPERPPEPPGTDRNLNGTWGTTVIDGEERVTGHLHFHADGRAEAVFTNQDGEKLESAGTWALTGTTLEMRMKEQDPVRIEITWLGPDRFSMKMGEYTVIYDRVR